MSTSGPSTDLRQQCWDAFSESMVYRCLQGYVMMFEAQSIGLEALLTISHDDLEALGVRSLGHRKAILQAFSAFVQQHVRALDLAAQH